MKVSVVLPTFNEKANIVPLIAAIKASISPPWEAEIIVVDDNSPDGTYDRVREAYGADPSVKVFLRTADHGLAKSIRTGIENATAEFILVMDTDFTHRPDEIPLMLHIIEKVDLVSGSRFCPGGSMDSTAHYVASFAYNLLIRLIIRTQVQDNLGGFWVARTDLIRKLPAQEIFYGYGDYYFRMLHYLQQSRAHLVEVPAHYTQRAAGTSKSNFLKLLLKYSVQAIRLALKKRHIEDFCHQSAKNPPSA